MKKLFSKALETTTKLLKGRAPDALDDDLSLPSDFEQGAEEARSDVLTDIEAALARIAKNSGLGVAGKVQVLQFDKLREELGAEWDKQRHRIEQAIRRVSQKYLGPQDLLRPFGECAFFMVFDSISVEEAEAKCALIRDEVEKEFAKDYNVAGKIQISTAVTDVSGEISLKEVGSIDEIFTRLKKANTEKKQAAKAAKVSGPEKKAPIKPPVHTESVGDEDSPDWKAFQAAAKKKGFSSTIGDMEGVPKEFWAKWRINAVDMDLVYSQFLNVVFAYQPIWDVQKQALVGYLNIPVKGKPPLMVFEDEVFNEDPEGMTALTLDMMRLERVMARLVGIKSKTFLASGLHYESVASARFRKQILASCNEISEEARQNLMFEIVGLPAGIITSSVVDASRAVTRFTRGVAVRFQLNTTDFSELETAGVRWVGFSLKGLVMSEERMMDAMAKFIDKARGAGLQVYAKDIPSKNMAMAAVGFGVGYVFGRPLLPTPEMPKERLIYSVEQLVAPG
jgi:hypothetical protein